MKLVTHFEYPPIPMRDFDWCAYDSDTYDAELVDGVWTSSSIVGRGKTEAEAIADYWAQLEDRS